MAPRTILPHLTDYADAAVGTYLAGGDAGAKFRPVLRAPLDVREFTAYDGELAASADPAAIINAAAAEAHAIDRGLVVPAGVYLLTSPIRLPELSAQLSGVGMDRTIFRSHPDYDRNGPLWSYPAAGPGVPMVDTTLMDLTFDGDFEAATGNTTFATLAQPVSATDGVDSPFTLYLGQDVSAFAVTADTEWEPGAGFARARFDDDPYVADPDHFEYTDIDQANGALLNVTRVVDGSHRPIAHAAGAAIRLFTFSPIGLARIYAYARLRLIRVHITRGRSYGLALEGTAETNRGPKWSLFAEGCVFDYNGLGQSGDGVDIKHSDFSLWLHCQSNNNGDKGFNQRGRLMVYLGCGAARNKQGFGIASRAPMPAEKYRYGRLKTAVSATDTTFVVDHVDLDRFSPLTGPGTGTCELEEISWTGCTNDGLDATGDTYQFTLTGVTRGLNGSTAVAHDAYSDAKGVRVVQNPIAGDVAEHYSSDPEGEYEGWGAIADTQADLVGCEADDNEAYGIVGVAGGVGTRMRMRVQGGSTRRNLNNIVMLSSLGIMQGKIIGHDADDAKANSVVMARVDRPTIVGLTSRGAGTSGGVTGAGLLLKDLYHGATVVGSDLSRNDGYGLKMEGATRKVRTAGNLYSANGLGDVLETNPATNTGLGHDGMIVHAALPPWNVTPDSTDNLDAIHAAIAFCAANGGGTVKLPPGTLKIRSAVIGQSGVVVEGAGMYATTLQLPGNAAVVVAGLTGTVGAGLRKLCLDGNFLHDGSLGTDGSHGISMSGAVGTQYAIIEHVWVRRVKSYGIGFQDAGPYIGNLVRHVRISDCGSDGIDFKNDGNLNRDNVIDDVLVERFGQSTGVTERAGVDIRGVGATLSNIRVREFGRAHDGTLNGAAGVRFRATSANGIGGEESSLTGFRIDGGDRTVGLGVVVSSGVRDSVTNGTIRRVGTAVQVVSASAIDTNLQSLSDVHAYDCNDYGFRIFAAGDVINSEVDGTGLSNCTADTCGVGFSIEPGARNTRLTIPRAYNCGTGIWVKQGAIDTGIVLPAYSGNATNYTNGGTNTKLITRQVSWAESMRPLTSIRETFPRHGSPTTTTAVTGIQSGRLELVAIELVAGDPVNEISFWSGSQGAVNPTHLVFSLFDLNRNLLAQTVDGLTAAWAAGAKKTLATTATYVVPETGRYMLGLQIVADTPPNLHGAATSVTINGVTPILVGTSSTGLTDTPPAVAGALTARAGTAYAVVN